MKETQLAPEIREVLSNAEANGETTVQLDGWIANLVTMHGGYRVWSLV